MLRRIIVHIVAQMGVLLIAALVLITTPIKILRGVICKPYRLTDEEHIAKYLEVHDGFGNVLRDYLELTLLNKS